MARANTYTFTIRKPPSAATAERMVRFLADTLAKYENMQVESFRSLSPEEAGEQRLLVRREAS